VNDILLNIRVSSIGGESYIIMPIGEQAESIETSHAVRKGDLKSNFPDPPTCQGKVEMGSVSV
jgi:hypothetical protein